MYLAKRNQRPWLIGGTLACAGAQLQKQSEPILLHVRPFIMLSEAKIQAARAIAGGSATFAGAETVDQPGKLVELGNLNRLQRPRW